MEIPRPGHEVETELTRVAERVEITGDMVNEALETFYAVQREERSPWAAMRAALAAAWNQRRSAEKPPAAHEGGENPSAASSRKEPSS